MRDFRQLKTFRLAAVAALGLLLAGCQNLALRPAPEAEESNVWQGSARASIQDVVITVQPDHWEGRINVAQQVTPARVALINNNDVPVRVRYKNFAFVAADGSRYSAIPPFNVRGRVQDARAIDPGFRISPYYSWSRFHIAPYYAPLYPGLSAYADPFFWDPAYQSYYYNYWSGMDVALPTEEMIHRALPEGVVDPGGEVEGFLYFEKVDLDQHQRLEFTVDLVNADNGEYVGSASIPFEVVER